MRGKDQAYWLADKIPAYGDYAKEAANVLRRQADDIERLHKENEKLRRVVKASEEFVSAESSAASALSDELEPTDANKPAA